FLVKLNSDVDFGNPALGKSRNDLLTFEAIDKQTGVSTVLALDLTAGVLGNAGQISGIAAPDYAGDDRAIIYSYPDFVNTDYSLVRHPLASNSVATNGPLTLWLSDGDEVTMYRRGAYVVSNALPTILLSAPTNGQIFIPLSNVQILTAPNDAD